MTPCGALQQQAGHSKLITEKIADISWWFNWCVESVAKGFKQAASFNTHHEYVGHCNGKAVSSLWDMNWIVRYIRIILSFK